MQPDTTKTKELWEIIWGQPQSHNTQAERLYKVKKKLNPWKAGPDGVKSFWIKQFSN